MLDDDQHKAQKASGMRLPGGLRTVALLALALGATALVACGKRAPEAAPPAATKAAATPGTALPPAASAPAGARSAPAPAAASSAFQVRSVTLGNAVDEAQHVSTPATHFAPDDKTLYASVASTGTTAGIVLNARWHYLEGAGQLISSVTQRLASDGPATTTFTLHNPDLWPEGKYDVQISVDGKLVETRTFTIGK